ncbi:alpha-ribazole phosphatase [Sphingomonas changnyeongensis]|uniref:Alpha-ribazole phosphatase n=1 Tax=Sphingomonas changnyeongensis TaxID=2698679 RepID=A0A7Z2S8L8_9SPHN|nr:histidine phosphatase family protein [Sphingomonas changnyeongensis]QHL91561.1 alpha-ribazole phosphatase [Sphingomonas changnyeongensis]
MARDGLILIRHTRPEVAPGICYGLTDLDCADSFADEAAAVCAALADQAGIDTIVSSPLRRCRKLAQTLAEHLGQEFEIEADIREMDFGSWEGLPWDRIGRDALDRWAGDFMHARDHGGESVAMLAARVNAALAAHRARPGRTLWVTHMGVIRAALAAAGVDGAWSAQVGYGAVLRWPEGAGI